MEVTEDGNVKPTLLGGSLPVDNVQALAASKDLSEIPHRYIRPEVMADVGNADADSIPVIDMSRVLDLESSDNEAAKLKMACEEWGFFQVINHGAADEMMNNVKADTEEFFKLPFEEKKAFAQQDGSVKLSLFQKFRN